MESKLVLILQCIQHTQKLHVKAFKAHHLAAGPLPNISLSVVLSPLTDASYIDLYPVYKLPRGVETKFVCLIRPLLPYGYSYKASMCETWLNHQL